MASLAPDFIVQVLETHRIVWLDPEPVMVTPCRLQRRYLALVDGRPRKYDAEAYRHPHRHGQWVSIAHGEYLDLPPSRTAQEALAAAEAWLAGREE